MPRPAPSRVAAALNYLERLKNQAAEFGGGVVENLADRARSAGELAYEALTSDPAIGRMTTAEYAQAADRPTPRLDQAARDIGTIGRAIVTQPVETGKAIVQGEVERAREAMSSPRAAGQYAGSFIDPMQMARMGMADRAPQRIAQALEAAPTVSKRPTALPTIKPGDVVDGYKVRPDIPNQSSIAASLDNYEVLPGIRSINMAEFDPQYVKSISPEKLDSRTRKLMDEISQSKELNPLIVAYDSKGPYIIEGGHRFDALAASKAKSVPAMVVIDMDDPPR